MKMCNDVKADDEKSILAFTTALDARKLELELFWKRSLFFWGFISSAFIGYASLHNDHSNIAILVANFGLVCSFAWSFSNRGSKFWYESWERYVTTLEEKVMGQSLFSKPSQCLPDEEEKILRCNWKRKISWLNGKRFSVSKLAIALSDYTVAIWLCIILIELNRIFFWCILEDKKKSVVMFLVCTLIYLASMLCLCDSSEDN